MALWLETDSSSNVNISSATAVGAYTATGDALILPQLLVDQVAGGGDYVYYVTLQVGGSGSTYVFGPKTTNTAAAGETALGAQGGFIFARSGDVLTVYVDGLAGDTTTPDVMVRWAAFPLPAATPGDTGGLALVGSTMVPDAAGTRTALGMADANLDEQLESIVATIQLYATAAHTIETLGIVSNEGTDLLLSASSFVGPHLVGSLVYINYTVGDSSSKHLTWIVAMDGNTATVASVPATYASLDTLEILDSIIPPSVLQIASQVRTELATELAHLDEDVSAVKADTEAILEDTGTTLPGLIAGIEAGSGLDAQETANAVHNLAPVGVAAAGSIGNKLNDMPATILSTVVAPYAATSGTFGYLLSLLAGLDFTQVNLVTTSNAGEITIKRGVNLLAVVSGLTIPADWTACYWTVKRSTDDPDADAIVQILVSNPGDEDDGILVLAGDTQVEVPSDGGLTVNQAGGAVTIALASDAADALDDAVELVWDVKIHTASGKTQPGAGTAVITTAVTRA